MINTIPKYEKMLTQFLETAQFDVVNTDPLKIIKKVQHMPINLFNVAKFIWI